MTKTISKSGKNAPRAGYSVKRDSRTGQFVLGRAAFTSISAVEGITISKGMEQDFERTSDMSAGERRSTLSSKYGKK